MKKTFGDIAPCSPLWILRESGEINRIIVHKIETKGPRTYVHTIGSGTITLEKADFIKSMIIAIVKIQGITELLRIYSDPEYLWKAVEEKISKSKSFEESWRLWKWYEENV